MSAIPSAEVVMERMRMALAEAGYPEASLHHVTNLDYFGWPLIGGAYEVPDAVSWAACELAYEGHISCWTCYQIDDRTNAWRCINGDCQHPDGPARPPRELLRAS